MTIKLKDIIPAPWNIRGEITPESVKELAQSIEEQGLINPITLWQNADGEWLCIAGNRRLAALLSLHSKDYDGELPKDHYTIFGGTEEEAKVVTVTENLQREDVGIIEEAECVSALLDEGKSVEWIAARLGRGRNWVNRRRKLVNLATEWKERADEMDADALEKIAAYPVEIQAKLAKIATGTAWSHVKYQFEREMHDIDAAPFDAKPCRECLKRTGVEADLFGVCDGKLGSCLDCKCYKAKAKAWEEAKIAEAIGDAESVKVDHEWQMPHEARQDMGDKQTRKHPCAWYWWDGGELVVKWAKSKKQIEVEKKAKDAAYEAEQKEHRAERDKIDAITEKLDAWANSDDDESKSPAGLDVVVAKIIAKSCDVVCRDYAIQAVAEKIANWHDGKEWAEVIRAFPAVIKLANITDEERDCLLSKYPIENENE